MKAAWMLLLLAAGAIAQTTRPSMSREQAIAELRCAPFFTSAYVGPTMAISTDVKAFNVLRQQPDAKDLFTKLQRAASPEGQLYALCGLYLIDRSAFDAVLAEYRERHGTVQTVEGCLVGEERINQVVLERIATGLYPRMFSTVSPRE